MTTRYLPRNRVSPLPKVRGSKNLLQILHPPPLMGISWGIYHEERVVRNPWIVQSIRIMRPVETDQESYLRKLWNDKKNLLMRGAKMKAKIFVLFFLLSDLFLFSHFHCVYADNSIEYYNGEMRRVEKEKEELKASAKEIYIQSQTVSNPQHYEQKLEEIDRRLQKDNEILSGLQKQKALLARNMVERLAREKYQSQTRKPQVMPPAVTHYSSDSTAPTVPEKKGWSGWGIIITIMIIFGILKFSKIFIQRLWLRITENLNRQRQNIGRSGQGCRIPDNQRERIVTSSGRINNNAYEFSNVTPIETPEPPVTPTTAPAQPTAPPSPTPIANEPPARPRTRTTGGSGSRSRTTQQTNTRGGTQARNSSNQGYNIHGPDGTVPDDLI